MAEIAADPTSVDLNPWAGTNPEGFLFPDTYNMEPHLAKTPFYQMASQFNTVAAELDLAGDAAALTASLGFEVTPQQIVVLASIIEAEVNRDEDRPLVARAMYNRLAQGIPLGVESVFRYGRLMVDGVPYADEIYTADQHNPDLPYNYYMHTGVPSTPIGETSWSGSNASCSTTSIPVS